MTTPQTKSPEQATDIADKIARDIMAAGNGPTPCRRIQFKGGKYPDSETDQGGFSESALAKCIRESLSRVPQPTNFTSPLTWRFMIVTLKLLLAIYRGTKPEHQSTVIFIETQILIKDLEERV